jgi:pilus assembly protein CpaF
MRPDRIVVGEVRDEAALDMLQAMNTGHEGSLTTVHANSQREAISRIETMVLMAGIDFPMRAIREQIHQSVDLIIQQSRVRDGSRKITSIVEITGIDGDTIQLQELFRFNYSIDTESQQVGHLQPTGIIPTFEEKFIARKVQLDRRVFIPR